MYSRTPGGVVYEVLQAGTPGGAVARLGDTVQFDYTLRRQNGYFIYSSSDCGIGCGDGTPFFATLGTTSLISGLVELIAGMKVGERRRALIPPALGYTLSKGLEPQPPDWGQRRQIIAHSAEPLIFELRLVKCRKL